MSAPIAKSRTSLTHRLQSPHGRFGDLAILAFVLVQGLDGAMTYLGLHIWGFGIEANPLVSTTVSMAGIGGGLALTKLFAIALGMILHLGRVHGIIALLVGYYVAIAIVPWAFLFLTLA